MLTLIQKGETVGYEEIVSKQEKRLFSMQVASESCFYLYLPAKQFKDKFFNQSFVMKHTVCEKLEVQDRFIEDLEAKRSAFQVNNAKMNLPVKRDEREELPEPEPEMMVNQKEAPTMQMEFTPDNIRAALMQNGKKKRDSKGVSHPSKIKGLAQFTNQKNNAALSKDGQPTQARTREQRLSPNQSTRELYFDEK